MFFSQMFDFLLGKIASVISFVIGSVAQKLEHEFDALEVSHTNSIKNWNTEAAFDVLYTKISLPKKKHIHLFPLNIIYRPCILCHVSQTIPEQLLQCGRIHYSAEKAHRH